MPLPMELDEYRLAQLYMVAKASTDDSTEDDGIECVENRPYDNEKGKGQYTYKIFHLKTKVPSWLRWLVPETAMDVVEQCWNAYPYCKTVYSSTLLGERFHLSVESMHCADDRGARENAVSLEEEELAAREIDRIDIVTDQVSESDHDEAMEPGVFRSEKTGRMGLPGDWITSTEQPVMTAYKVVRAHFGVWGLQGRMEAFIHRNMRDILLKYHKKCACWIDQWHGLTIDDIRRIEDDAKERLDQYWAEEAAARPTASPPVMPETPRPSQCRAASPGEDGAEPF